MDDELQNPLYRNWVKATLGLRQLQLGLAPYVDRLAREQHAVLLGTLQHAAPLHRHISPCPIQHNNDGCSANPIRHSTEESKTCQSCKFDICRTCGLSCCQSCGHLDLPTEISTNCTSCDLKTCKDCIKIICTTCFSGLNVLHCMTVDQGQTLEKNFVHDAPCVFASCISCKETYCTKCYVCQHGFCNCLTKSIRRSHNSKTCINKAKKQTECNCKKEIAANCVKNACGGIYDEIIRKHTYNDPIWVNTDPRYWRTSYWEVAKCFLSSGGYSKRQSAKETDASGLLSVCINSNFINKHLRNASNFSKARAIRHDVFHSCDSKLSDGDLQQHLDCMLAVLKDTQEIESTSQTSIDCIIKLKSDTFEIRHVDSDYAKNERIKQLSDKQSKMEEEIAELRRDVDNATRDRKKLREDIERLKSLLTHKEADDVTGTGEVTIDVENVTPGEEKIISDDIVNVVGNIAQGRKVDTNDVVARATMNGYEKLHKENKRVTEAKSECIHLTIECTTLTALVSLFEDCLTDNMTSILEPLERAIQEKYRLPKLRLVARMSAEDIRASMKDVVSKLNKKADRDNILYTRVSTSTGTQIANEGVESDSTVDKDDNTSKLGVSTASADKMFMADMAGALIPEGRCLQFEIPSHKDQRKKTPLGSLRHTVRQNAVTNVSTSNLEKTERKRLRAGTSIEDDNILYTRVSTSTGTQIANEGVESDATVDKDDNTSKLGVSSASADKMLMVDMKAGALIPDATFLSTASTANMLMGDMKTGSPVLEVTNVSTSNLEKTERKSLQAGTSLEDVSFPTTTDVEILTDATKQLSGQRGKMDPLPSWEEANSQLKERRTKELHDVQSRMEECAMYKPKNNLQTRMPKNCRDDSVYELADPNRPDVITDHSSRGVYTRRVSEYSSWPAYKYTCDHVSNISAQCRKLFYRLGVEDMFRRLQVEQRLYRNVHLNVVGNPEKDGPAQTVERMLHYTSAYKEIKVYHNTTLPRGLWGKEDSQTQWGTAYDPIIFVADDGYQTVLFEVDALLKTAPSLKSRICVFLLQRGSKIHPRSKHWSNNCSVVNTKPAELIDDIDDFLERYALETSLSLSAELYKLGLLQQQPANNSSVNQSKSETVVAIEELLKRIVAMYKRSNANLPESLKTIDPTGKTEDNTVIDALLKSKNVIACGDSYGTIHVFVEKDGEGLAEDVNEIKSILGTRQNAIHMISRQIRRLAKIGNNAGESQRFGTLGCFATSRGNIFALISKHVAEYYAASGTIKLGKSIYGQLQLNVELEATTYRDIATAAIRPDDIDKCDPAFHDDDDNAKECILFDHNNDIDSLSELVFFRGAATTIGKGVVFLKEVNGIQGIDRGSHMLIASRQDGEDGNVSKFCQPGDSGAVVCACDRKGKLYALGMIVGELIGGTEDCASRNEEKYLVLKLDAGLRALDNQHGGEDCEENFKLCN